MRATTGQREPLTTREEGDPPRPTRPHQILVVGVGRRAWR
jgi:hypothetical protein